MTALPVAPCVVLLGLIAGIVAAGAGGPGDAPGPLAVGVAGAVVAGFVTRSRLRVVVAVVAFGLIGTAVMQRALHGMDVSPLSALVRARADVVVRGNLLDDPDGTRFSARVPMRVDAIARGARPDHSGGRRHVLVFATRDAGPRLALLAAGDRVTLRGWLEPLRGTDERWRWRHVVAVLHARALLAAAPADSVLGRVANATRAVVLRGSSSLGPVDRALLSGFLLGDTRGLPDDVTERFRLAGLTHLLAVSGENVAFVLALFAPLLRRLSLLGRLVGGAGVLVLFGTMTRWEPSVLRAITMAMIGLVAGFVGRPTAGLRALVVAVIALLVADPFLLHSVGFLLSCGASLGIVVLARPICDRLPGPLWMREVLAVTAAAQVGVAPVLIPVFGSMPLVSLPANLVAVPLAAPLTVWGLAAGATGGMVQGFAPRLASVLCVPTRLLLHGVLTVSDVASRVPFVIDGRAAWAAIAVAALSAAAARVVRVTKVRRDARTLPARRPRPRPHAPRVGDGNPEPHS